MKMRMAFLWIAVGIVVGAARGGEEEMTPASRAAVERGLAALAARQNPDGSWSARVGAKVGYNYSVQGHGPHVGITSIACLAFMAGGNVPGRGRYGEAVSRGLDYVLSCVGPDGWIGSSNTRMYSHAFAALFLAEVCGESDRPDLQEKLRTVVTLMARAQNEEGGWRYLPMDRDSDMSVTVCVVQALRAARNNGVHVPVETIDRAVGYIRRSHVPHVPGAPWLSGGFKYQPAHVASDYNRVTYPLTAAGLTALYGLGVYHGGILEQGLAFLERPQNRLEIAPWGRRAPPPGFPVRFDYFYGQYYAAQAMFQAGGAHWERWFPAARDEIVFLQRPDGTWRDAVDPTYATAMACLVLQIPYRYLPIFQR